MNVTWTLGFPDGDEAGAFLTIDLGGTNLRVCWIVLKGRGENTEVNPDTYRLPSEIKTGTAEQLWSHIVDALADFISKNELRPKDGEQLPLGFTFSYPATQDFVDHGVLQRWTKGLEIKGVEGEDAAGQLIEAMRKRVSRCIVIPGKNC